MTARVSLGTLVLDWAILNLEAEGWFPILSAMLTVIASTGEHVHVLESARPMVVCNRVQDARQVSAGIVVEVLGQAQL